MYWVVLPIEFSIISLFCFVWCMAFSMMVSALPPEQLLPALDALCIPILTPLQVSSLKLQDVFSANLV